MKCADLIRDNYKLSKKAENDLQHSVKLYFLWSDREGNVGVIDPKPIPITATENTDLRVKLPFNVKIMV